MDEIIKLKAEIFDLQLEFNRVRQKIEDKIKKLNVIVKQNGPTSDRILPQDGSEGKVGSST